MPQHQQAGPCVPAVRWRYHSTRGITGRSLIALMTHKCAQSSQTAPASVAYAQHLRHEAQDVAYQAHTDMNQSE